MEGKLYKSSRDKIIDGVCGGIAEYFDVDSSIVRLVWALAIFFGGTGIFLYIIAAIILPRDTELIGYNGGRNEYRESDYTENEYIEEKSSPKEYNNENSRKTIGIILIVVGIFLFLRRFLYIFDFEFFWPFILVALGVFLIFKGKRD